MRYLIAILVVLTIAWNDGSCKPTLQHLRITSSEVDVPLITANIVSNSEASRVKMVETSFVLFVDSAVPDVLILVPEGRRPDSLVVSFVDSTGMLVQNVSGKQVGLHDRSLPMGGTIVRLPPVRNRDVVVTVRTNADVMPTLIVRSLAVHERWVTTRQMISSILYGLILFAVIVSIVFFIAFRDQSYLWYTLYLISFFLFVLQGDTRWIVTSTISHVPFMRSIAPHLVMIVLLLALQFSRTFLSVRSWSVGLNRFYWGVMLLVVLITILHATQSLTGISNQFVVGPTNFVFGISALLFLGSGIRAWQKGYRYAVYYTMAWTAIAFAIIFIVAVDSIGIDVVASPFLRAAMGWQMLISVSAGVEIILLTLGAASRLRDQRRSQDLLRAILPESIVERLRGKSTKIADNIESATVVFCDIVGFTRLSTQVTATDLIQDLESVFTIMDTAAKSLGIEKIKTIGDAYMVVAGAPVVSTDHAQRAVEFAQRVMRAMPLIKSASGEPILLRIGIHSGPIVAGVIGTWKFGYDVWGETVNVASRIEGKAHPGTITISSATAAKLGPNVRTTSIGSISLRGVGEMECFEVGF